MEHKSGPSNSRFKPETAKSKVQCSIYPMLNKPIVLSDIDYPPPLPLPLYLYLLCRLTHVNASSCELLNLFMFDGEPAYMSCATFYYSRITQ